VDVHYLRWEIVWRNAPRIWRNFGSALPFQTRLTQKNRFYHCQTSTAHRKRIKVDGSVAIISIKNLPMDLHVMYLHFPDTPHIYICIHSITCRNDRFWCLECSLRLLHTRSLNMYSWWSWVLKPGVIYTLDCVVLMEHYFSIVCRLFWWQSSYWNYTTNIIYCKLVNSYVWAYRVVKFMFTYSYSMMQWRSVVVCQQPACMSATEEGQCYRERALLRRMPSVRVFLN